MDAISEVPLAEIWSYRTCSGVRITFSWEEDVLVVIVPEGSSLLDWILTFCDKIGISSSTVKTRWVASPQGESKKGPWLSLYWCESIFIHKKHTNGTFIIRQK